jgi:hypothetical protein
LVTDRPGNVDGMDTPALLSSDALTIYLNDHLSGATAGTELADRTASENEDTEFGRALRELAAEIDHDRDELLAIMGTLEIQVDHVKLAVGWTAEKLARLKPNGRVFSYSPLSRLLELEGLAAGIRGKRALWRALKTAALPGVDPERLDVLLERASRQLRTVDRLHARAAELALAGSLASASA